MSSLIDEKHVPVKLCVFAVSSTDNNNNNNNQIVGIVPIESGTQREVGELECPLLRNGKPTTLSSLEKSAQKSTRRERKSTKVVVPRKVVQNSILLSSPEITDRHQPQSAV